MNKNIIALIIFLCTLTVIGMASAAGVTGGVGSASGSSLNGIVTSANSNYITCINENPNINSSMVYFNNNQSLLAIVVDTNVLNAGSYGTTPSTITEAVNTTGSNGHRSQSTMYIPSQNYFQYTFSSAGTNIFHCRWISTTAVATAESVSPPISSIDILFALMFGGAIIFIVFFLVVLPQDLKKESLRPLFVLLFAIGLWVATLPAFLAPANTISVAFPAYNVIQGGTIAQFPAFTVNAISTLQARAYNAYFYIWLGIFIFLLFLLLFWFIMVLRQKTQRLLKGGKDMMETFERGNK